MSDDIYRISTFENYFRFCEGIYKMALISSTFKKVDSYEMFSFVAVQIDGMWLVKTILMSSRHAQFDSPDQNWPFTPIINLLLLMIAPFWNKILVYFRLRGRILSYNEFLSNNTTIELIDTGSIVNKPLNDLYYLPEELRYDPLVSDNYIYLY